jgi:hypothetical protein
MARNFFLLSFDSGSRRLLLSSMRIVHNLLFGASSVLLDAFAGDPVASATITVPDEYPIAGDFGRVSADLREAMNKVEHARQLELAL